MRLVRRKIGMTALGFSSCCLVLLAHTPLAIGDTPAGFGAAQQESFALEPPALRDIDDKVIDLMKLAVGEERALGEFFSAIGREESVTVVRRGPEPLEIECVRRSDRCLVIVHADGTAELWRARSTSCPEAEGEADGQEDEDVPGLVRRRIVRGEKCFEDLRVMTPAPKNNR